MVKKTASIGDPVVFIPCLGKNCLKQFRQKGPEFNYAKSNIYIKHIYGVTQNIVCPHCGQKMKARCFKNGNVSLSIR